VLDELLYKKNFSSNNRMREIDSRIERAANLKKEIETIER